MPRFLPSLLAGLLAAVLCALAVRTFVRLAAEPDWDFTGPGQFTFTAPKAGRYLVWHRVTASVDGVYRVQENRLPAGTTISVGHGGKVVPTKVNGSNTVSRPETGDKISVLSFEVPEPGEYVIDVAGMTEKQAFSMSPDITFLISMASASASAPWAHLGFLWSC